MEASNALSYTFNSVRHEMVCDVDAISGLPGVLDRAGATRALVLCGPSILAHSDVVPRVQEALGDAFAGLYSGVAPHSPVATLDAVVAQARETGADALISVGGGSTHDTTKGVATVLGEGGRIHDYEAKWVRA
jgi:alcohol dehydrogenase class IV